MKKIWEWLEKRTDGLVNDTIDIERWDYQAEYDAMYNCLIDPDLDILKMDKNFNVSGILVVDTCNNLVYIKEHQLLIRYISNAYTSWCPEFEVCHMNSEDLLNKYAKKTRLRKNQYESILNHYNSLKKELSS